MAYDESLAQRIRDVVESVVESPADRREIAMFGGLCWTVNTHMVVGTIDDGLMAYVGTDGVAAALERGARRAVMGGRTTGGVVLVSATDLPDADSIEAWIRPAVDRAWAKPPKRR